MISRAPKPVRLVRSGGNYRLVDHDELALAAITDPNRVPFTETELCAMRLRRRGRGLVVFAPGYQEGNVSVSRDLVLVA